MASSLSSPVVTRLSIFAALALAVLAAPAAGQNAAQTAPAAPPPATTAPAAEGAATTAFSGTDDNLSPAQLQTLVAPIALYPDDLVAIVLPASTQPLQIVDAQRLLDKRKSDAKAEPPKSWDPSVVALLNYPEVIALMNKDLTWTQQLGTSVIDQQAGVMDAIQSFRKKVQAAGNLKSDDKQKVVVEKETVVIQPADPQVIYVPTYNPTTVVYAPAPSAPPPYAYSAPYPYYYSPGAAFFTGAVFGAAVGYAIGWNNHDIYHGDVNINNNVNRNINNANINRSDVNRTNLNNQRSNIARNRENAWRPSSSAVNQAQVRRTAAGGGAAARPVSSGQISAGLAQRDGGTRQATGGRAQGGNVRGTTAGNRSPSGAGARQNTVGGRTASSATPGNRAAGNRDVGNRASPGGGQRSSGSAAASRQSGAFSGANNAAAANRASARGNQSLGNHGGFQGRSAPAGGGARGGGGGGGRRR
jgi:hypothetical protein